MFKNKRHNFFTNKKFQLRLAAYVSSWVLVMCFIYPLVVQSLFDFFVNYAKADPHGPEIASILKIRDDFLTYMIATQVTFIILTFLVSMFLAHRIAGPLNKLRLTFKKVRAGDLSQGVFFRKDDHFQELAQEYNETIEDLKNRIDSASTQIRVVAANSNEENQKILLEALQKLPQIQPQKSKPEHSS